MGFLRSSSDAADPKLVGMCMCRTDREREQLAKRLSKEGPMIRSILKPDELILGITRTEETMTELVVVTDRRVFVVRNLKVKNISAHSEIRKKTISVLPNGRWNVALYPESYYRQLSVTDDWKRNLDVIRLSFENEAWAEIAISYFTPSLPES